MVGMREKVEHFNPFQTIALFDQVSEVPRPGRRVARCILKTSRLQFRQAFEGGFAYPCARRIENNTVRVHLCETPEKLKSRLSHGPNAIQAVQGGVRP